jgi:hypothetical protein
MSPPANTPGLLVMPCSSVSRLPHSLTWRSGVAPGDERVRLLARSQRQPCLLRARTLSPALVPGGRRPRRRARQAPSDALERPDLQRLVAYNLVGAARSYEPDALFLGVLDLLRAPGSRFGGAAVDEIAVCGAQTKRSPDRVHRRVAAADHGNPLPVDGGVSRVGVPYAFIRFERG